jgi:hypothetical protein
MSGGEMVQALPVPDLVGQTPVGDDDQGVEIGFSEEKIL